VESKIGLIFRSRFNSELIFIMKIIASLVMLALTGSLRADLFDFSYQFGDGQTVTGSFNGTAGGATITDASNFSVLVDGLQFYLVPPAAPVFGAKYTQGSGYSSGPIFAYDIHQNNFEIGNADFANGDFGGNWYFNLGLNEANKFVATLNFTGWGLVSDGLGGYVPGPSAQGADGDPQQWQWSLVDVTDPTGGGVFGVPDASGTFGLLGAAVGALALFRARITARRVIS
jgi:hypothetical protein